MAITKTTNFYGFETPIYVKVGGILIKETGKDEVGKLYSMESQIDYYTNDTKEYHFSQTTDKVENLRLNECNIETSYSKLKAKPEFEGFTDC